MERMAWMGTKRKMDTFLWWGYHNITTNLSKSFNHILKGAHVFPVSALVQLIFFRTNAYFVKQKEDAYDYIAQRNYSLLLFS